MAEAAEIARAAALAAPTAGRPLAAANAALSWPDPPHLQLWQAQTVLREHRGDGHVAALLTAGLDPVEALLLFAADQDLDGDWLRTRRGWSEPEWAQARERLVARGLIEPAGPLTPAGRAAREAVERCTDELADHPWAAVGDERANRLVELVAPLVAAIVAGEGFLPVNPMGLRPLVPAPLSAGRPLIRRRSGTGRGAHGVPRVPGCGRVSSHFPPRGPAGRPVVRHGRSGRPRRPEGPLGSGRAPAGRAGRAGPRVAAASSSST